MGEESGLDAALPFPPFRDADGHAGARPASPCALQAGVGLVFPDHDSPLVGLALDSNARGEWKDPLLEWLHVDDESATEAAVEDWMQDSTTGCEKLEESRERMGEIVSFGAF